MAAFSLRGAAVAVLLTCLPAAPAVAGAPDQTTRTVGAAADAMAIGVFGDAGDHGSMLGKRLAQPVVGMAATATGRGYWLVARDGGIFSFGDATFRGSTGAMRLNQPIVGMTATPSGKGYWFVAADGGVFSFGDAAFRGSTGAMRLTRPIVGMATTPTGRGYWLVASDGGIFSFGDAAFVGSAGGMKIGSPITGITATPSGQGYWLAVADGRVLRFGDADRLGDAAGGGGSVVGMAATPTGDGYWLAASDGTVKATGDAQGYGSANASAPVVGITRTPSGAGFWLVTANGAVLNRVGTNTSRAYGFLSTDPGGSPVRFNPCRPVRYVINPTGAPGGAVDEVHEAFRRMSATTGIRFDFAGTTAETHLPIAGSTRRPSYQPERYGAGQWAPILVSWASSSAEPVLAGSVLGYGGSTARWASGTDRAYVTGEIVLDRDLGILRGGFGAGMTRGNLVLHELGHVVGLDHIHDQAQVMNPAVSPQTPATWGAGDRAGLARLGAGGGCLRVVSPTGGVLP